MALLASERTRLQGFEPVAFAGASIGALATVFGVFLEHRPNRVQSGLSVSALEAFGDAGWILLGVWIALALLLALPTAFPHSGRATALAAALLAASIVPVSLLLASQSAESHIAAAGDLARTSLGASFWLYVFAVYLVLRSSVLRITQRWLRAGISLLAPSAVIALAAAGALGSLSIMIEYTRFERAFWENFQQHVAYTLGTTGVALLAGVALGVWAAKRARAEAAIFGVLNVAQVMPALAFVGLIMPSMGWLAENSALARAIGVSGIGWAPVFLVLVMYALYPITRNTYAAIRALDKGVTDAARGMGMDSRRRLLSIELPLAAPVVMAGIRIALVQTAAGAILAALVGGGGLGRIVFYGLEQTAEDLVVLGIIAIVGLGLTLDVTLRFLIAILDRTGGSLALQKNGLKS